MNVRMCSIVSKHAALVCICVVFGSAGPLPGCSEDNRPVVFCIILASFFKHGGSWSSCEEGASHISGFLLRLR